jgi:hypothetical protein
LDRLNRVDQSWSKKSLSHYVKKKRLKWHLLENISSWYQTIFEPSYIEPALIWFILKFELGNSLNWVSPSYTVEPICV